MFEGFMIQTETGQGHKNMVDMVDMDMMDDGHGGKIQVADLPRPIWSRLHSYIRHPRHFTTLRISIWIGIWVFEKEVFERVDKDNL